MPKGIPNAKHAADMEKMELVNRVMVDDLSPEDQGAIISAETEKFKAEELEAKKKAFAAVVARDLRKARGRAKPGELVEDIVIDVAPFAIVAHGGITGILIDGQMYEHGKLYTLPASTAKSVRDMCARSWRHERTIKGESELIGRPFQQMINTRASMTVSGGRNQ